MIYEIFKQVYSFEHSLVLYCLAVVVLTNAAFFLCWLLGTLYSKHMAFITDSEVVPENPFYKFFERWYPKKNGWYKSSDIGEESTWRYRKYLNDVQIERSDRTPEEVQPALPTRISLKVLPSVLGVLALVGDFAPLFMCGVVLYVSTMFTSRKVFRVAKKLKQHLEDKSVHVGEVK